MADGGSELERARADAARLRFILDSSPNLVFINQSRRVVYVNRRCEELTGYTARELTARDFDFMVLVPPELRERVGAAYQRHMEGLAVEPYESEFVTKDGRRVEVVIASHLIEYEGDAAILGILTILSEQKRVERELRVSEQRYRQLVETSPDPIVLADLQGRLTMANAAAAAMHGYASPEEMATEIPRVADLLTEESRAIYEESGFETGVFEFRRPDGSTFEVEVRGGTLFDAEDRPEGVFGIARDVSDQLAAQRALAESEARYRTLLETCPDAILATDLYGKVVMANEAAARLRSFASVAELISSGGTALDAVVPEQRERAIEGLWRTLREGTVLRFEHDIVDASGERIIPVEITTSVLRDPDGSPTGFVAVLRDLTESRTADEERRRLEAQVQHAQRLESLGVLAGGIAHDFNNILVGVLGNASIVARELRPDAPLRQYVDQIAAAAQRAAGLTEQMLAYSGGSQYQAEPLHLAEAVAEMAHLLEAAIPKGISLEYDFHEDVPPVCADRARVQQVAMNLITNAAEAMHATGGVVRIRVALVPGAQVAATHPLEATAPAADRDYVCLAVRDTGTGMDELTRERMFEPFFTTKFTGRGLGLAAVVGIVRGHNGCLSVATAPGEGTCFSVFIPASAAAVAETSAETGAAARVAEHQQGTVLVVDDEELVRGLAEQVLVSAGFRVLTACDGAEALDLARCGGIDVVVLDLTMPRVGGLEALAALREICPGLPVVLSSGYSEREAVASLEAGDVASFVKKPYRPEQLIAAVTGALQDRG